MNRIPAIAVVLGCLAVAVGFALRARRPASRPFLASAEPLSASAPELMDPVPVAPREEAEPITTAIEPEGSVPATVLFGVVLDAETGEPVPDVHLRLLEASSETRSAADGSYELPSMTRPAEATLVLTAKSFLEQVRSFRLPREEGRVRADLRLERGYWLHGRVLDFESGAGIPGAELWDLVTDESGNFGGRILLEPGRTAVMFAVEAGGHASLYLELGLAELGAPLELRLPRSVLVEGTVRDPVGRPVAGASLYLRSNPRAAGKAQEVLPLSPLDAVPSGWRYRAEPNIVRTDDVGRFRGMAGVPWRTHLELHASADGYATAVRSIERLGGPGETMQVDLVLEREPPGGTLSGEVWLNGTHLRTAEGWVLWQGPTRRGEARIHAGRFHQAVELGEVAFRVELEGFAAQLAGAEFTLRIDGDRQRRVELRAPTKPISGRVLVEDGRPAAAASLSVSCALRGTGEGYWERLHLSTEAAVDGTYRLEVPDGALYRVEAELDHARRTLDGIGAGASGVDLVLAVSGILQCRFVDASGGLLSPELFELLWRTSQDLDENVADSLTLGAPDPEGWHEIRLPRGRTEVRAREASSLYGYLPTATEAIGIALDAPRRVEFRMLLGQSFVLRLAQGQEPLPRDHRVFLLEEEHWSAVRHDPELNSWYQGGLGDALWNRWVSFDAQGATTLRGCAPGRFRFKAFPPDLVFEPEMVELVASSEPVTVRWRRAH